MGLQPAVATVSLGRPAAGHALLSKVEQAAKHSMKGIEVFFECLQFHAQTLEGGLDDANLLLAARQVRQCCDLYGITVITLQPFTGFGGLTDPLAHAKALERLEVWFQLARVLGTDLIQIPTNFLPKGTTGDRNRIIADMTKVATMGMKQEPPIRFAYEAVSWGNHIDTWEGSWDIVKAVNMPNFGLCLDSFHIVGRVWGDPTAISGRNINGPKELARSMAKMVEELDVNKIFYVQFGDAEILDPPLSESNPLFVQGQPPRMTWSRNARLFPFEGGYLPIMAVLKAIVVDLGYQGWLSLESFNRDLFSERCDLPSEYASRAEASWNTLYEKILEMK